MGKGMRIEEKQRNGHHRSKCAEYGVVNEIDLETKAGI
jgi:hypothetical protein